MNTRTLIFSVLVSAIVSAGAYLLTHWLLTRSLTAGDYITAAITSVVVGIVIFFLFRNRNS